MNRRLLKERIYKLFKEPRSLQRFLARRFLFKPFEMLGYHLVADHFYEPIPNLRLVKDLENKKLEIPGHDFEDQDLINDNVLRLKKFGPEFWDATKAYGYKSSNFYFNRCDALHLYSLVREYNFKRVVEVGQGYSSRIICAAMQQNLKESERTDVEFISIDPYDRLGSQGGQDTKIRIRTINRPVQSLQRGELLKLLGPNTLLFLDSSHVYKKGSDVEFYFQQILPFLPQGTVFHIHDVFLPWTWPSRYLVERKWFWNEHDFLHAYLAHNASLQLLLPVYHWAKTVRDIQDVLREIFEESVSPGASIYFKVNAAPISSRI